MDTNFNWQLVVNKTNKKSVREHSHNNTCLNTEAIISLKPQTGLYHSSG